MNFVAIVGRYESGTGGEYYNVEALHGLSEVLGNPFVLEMAAAPSWISWLNRPITRYFYILAMNVWTLARLRRIAATHCYIDFFCYRYLWLFMMYSRFRRPRLLVVVHGLYHVLMREGLRRRLVMSAERMFLSGCSEIVTTSRDTAKRLRSELYLVESPITAVPPGIAKIPRDGVDLSPRGNRVRRTMRILYVGMVMRDKGLIDLVKALILLSTQGIKAKLHIAGRLDIEPQYTKEIRHIAGKGLIRFHGFLSRRALLRLYRGCDIFVLPSHFETFGMVITEAMQMGLPIIAANSGGVSETVRDGKNGLLYTPGNIEELVSHLKRLIESPELRERLRASSLTHAERFPDWSEVRGSFRSLARSFC